MRNYKCKADGKKYRIEVVGDSVQECYDKMEEREKKTEQAKREAYKTSLENPNIIFVNALYDWLRQNKSTTNKANSYDRIECIIHNQVEGYDIALWKAADITTQDLNNHLHYLQFEREEGTYSLSTLKKVYDLFHQFFEDFYRNNPTENPMKRVSRPQRAKNVGEISLDNIQESLEIKDLVLSDSEIKAFKEVCYSPRKTGTVGSSKYGIALYFVMLTFLRIGEATALTWNDIDFDRKVLKVTKGISRVRNRDKNATTKTKVILTKPKTEKSIREVMLTDEALEALNHIKEHSCYTAPNDLVICTSQGKQVLGQNLCYCLKGILKAAGLNKDGKRDKFGLHYLRHTGISYYLRHKISVEIISQMAGHASTAITMRTYYHIINEQREQALNEMNSIKI